MNDRIRISSPDGDDRQHLEKQLDDGSWQRIEPAPDLQLQLGQIRNLHRDALEGIADDYEHHQRALAQDALDTADAFIQGAMNPGNAAAEALSKRFRGPVEKASGITAAGKEQAEALANRTARPSIKTPTIEQELAENPVYQVVERLDEQNQILQDQRDQARGEAKASARHSRWALIAAWAGVAAAVIVPIIFR
ncbi:hypothetical protein [Brachybacterium subflavum]|uniref:hypothetical protein n=1 Tax=Brachybacterium subflavum TaxID=2585206 RepID=UPI00126625B5|nr:hypothetical protein [Brachybacterium subflavum]